ncbi:MAG: hypothetical protein K2O44_00940 [Clostridia bacterium]|nr:hypothetical protein [Clostridia bacterium]
MLYILTPIFCVAFACGTVFSFSNNGNKLSANAAATTPKTNAAYLDLNGSGNILNGFEGKQKEYVYFGTNVDSSVDFGNTGSNAHTGAIKWSVLAKNDTKYGDGNNKKNLLLFADYQIGKEYYNMNYNNPEYAFWGTSYIRAILNSGIYASKVNSTTRIPELDLSISESDSYYGHIFSLGEKAAVSGASEYTTDLMGLTNSTRVSGTTYWQFEINSITAEGSDVAGKYNTDRLNSTDHPSAAYARVTSDGGVQETTSGDKLFLLDYYDLNNLDYGFGDDTNADGVIDQTFASKLDPDWEDSGVFPSPFEDASATVSYLGFSDDLANGYWLRNAGRYSTNSEATVVDHRGFISDMYVDWYGGGTTRIPTGVRPAFVLDTSKIAYATTEIPGTGWANMTNVPTTPEYKLYLKDGSYAANTANAKASIGAKGSTLHIKYNNPTGVSNGKLIVLLTPSSSTGGEVDYQTAITMDSSATAAKMAYTTLTLPANVSLATHDVTLLYTTSNSGHSTDSIYCSYGMNPIDAPLDIEVTYDGNSKWLTALSGTDKPGWLDTDIYCNEAYMSVDTIKYTDNVGTQTNVTVSTSDIKAAGTYVVTMKIEDHLRWTGESADGGTKDFTIKIKQKPSTPVPKVNPPQTTTPYVSAGLPNLIADSGSTPGTFTWGTDEVATVGTKEYNWNFTPTDANNFTTATGKLELEFAEVKITGLRVEKFNTSNTTIYTSFTVSDLKQLFEITAIKNDGSEEELTSYDLRIRTADGKLQAGNNTVVISTNDGSVTLSPNYVISGVVAVEVEEILLVDMSTTVFTYPVTLEQVKAAITDVRVKWNNGNSGPLGDLSVVTVNGTLNVGTSVTINIGIDGVTLADPYDEYIVINKGTFDVTGITFTGDTLTYDGNTHSIAYSGTLPDGVSVEYEYSGTKQTTPFEFTNAGTYNITLSFTHSNANYNTISTTIPATLKIDKATVTGITFASEVKPEITGTTYTLEATGYPGWVTVDYYCDGVLFTGASAAGEYDITAKFTIDAAHAPNYEPIPDMTKTLTISDKPPVEGAENIVVPSAITETYTGSPVDYAAQNVPGGVEVTYEIEKDGAVFSGTDIINVGVYTVTVKFKTAADKAPIADKTCTVTVVKADVDMSGVKFEDLTVAYDGKEHTLTYTGTLPTVPAITVTYVVKDSTELSFTEIGTYEFTATFTHGDTDNYNLIEDKTATLTISDASILGITAKAEDGAKFTTVDTLDDLKKVLTVTVNTTGGDSVTEDYELSCDGLRDGGMFKYGLQKITVKYADEEGNEYSTFVEICVEKEKVALPVFKGGLSYTGVTVKPTVDNFNGYDSALMTFVTDKLQSGLTVGTYKAVFALNDPDNYDWATTTTLKKAVFAVALYDEEITLSANEAAVDWNIAKAVITATKKDNALPVFASESYIGAFSDVVALKYYADEACTEEVAAEDLAYETQYFVKAELIDTENFELDASAAAYTVKSFSYTTPAKELTTWDKVVRFLKANWLWLVIAVVALILLITLIALLARAAKKKREKAELAEQRRLEREEREREERKLEREERMARLSQQQAMPQMMMPQMMPQMMGGQMPMQQSMPQAAQPAAAGGGSTSDAQFAQIQSELAAMRAEQAAMRTEVAIRAEQAAMKAEQSVMHSEIYAMRGGEPIANGGVSLDKLTEIIRTEVKNALANEKAAAQPAPVAPESSSATQVPPDAVMTTVTTTKIDTTKKPAQAAQASAPAPATRTVVRNFVAPMPVDDGRVFDVGGFYTPADPVNDLGISDEENKD